MTAGAFEVVAIAFVAQLAALPGEKVQFIIAALSTRYRPPVVVAGAGSAFAGWTILEIVFGSAIQGIVPGVYLDAATAVLFLAFAVMLLRSVPTDDGPPWETDGDLISDEWLDVSLRGRNLRNHLGGFPAIFALMAAGEFGDKTQLVTIGLAVQYGAHPGIWLGEMLAIIPVSLLNAYFFHRFAGRFDLRSAHVVSAGVFLFFATDTILHLVIGVSVWGTVITAVEKLLFVLA